MFLQRLLVLLLVSAPVVPAATEYEIDLADAQSGWLGVTIEASCPKAECDFQMPVWNATYQVRNFAQYVKEFQAADEAGEPIAYRKVKPSLWRLEPELGRRVQVTYSVLADRPGPFGAYADAEHVCLNLAQVLMYPVASRREQFSLSFRGKPDNWKVAITLPDKDGRYLAASYDRLVDTPVHLSDFAETGFQHAGRHVRVVAHPKAGDYNLKLLKQTARKIVAAATELMNDVPFPSYAFVYHFSDVGGGGMEYRNGTSIWAPSKCSDCRLAPLAAHEFFHLWNVKRIRPRSLEPVDFTKPNITPSLWFAEGVTSTYARYIQLRAGLTSESEFLSRLAHLINRYERRPASREQSAEESSIDAWLELYPAYGREDRSISYYLRGELIGYLLDLTIRHASGNRRSLDDVMRALNRIYGQPDRYYEDTDAIERLASQVAGRDLAGEIQSLVRSAGPIPWNRYLGFAGYRLGMSEERRVRTGLTFYNPPGQGVVVSAVKPGSPGEKAGFRRGDRVYRVNGRRVSAGVAAIERRIVNRGGRKIRIAIERDGAPMALELVPSAAIEKEYYIVEVEQPTRLQLEIRRGWLEGRTLDQSTQLSH